MWLTLAVLSYILLAIAAFLDKYILGGSLPSPKMYSFYTGILSLPVVLLIPIGFLISVGFLTPLQRIFPDPLEVAVLPSFPLVILSFSAGALFLLSLFFYYKSVIEFEVSRVGPMVGAIIPLFTLGFIYIFTFIPINLGFEKEGMDAYKILALIFLMLGSFSLSLHKEKTDTFRSLKMCLVASFLFGLSFIFIKIVYNFLPFWTGFIWMKVGSFLTALCFLFFREVRMKVFNEQKSFAKKKIALPFILCKGSAALANVLQNGAIFLAPVIFLPIINALAGFQYIFLIILATFLFFKFPNILKEEISRKVIAQKTLAIWLIVLGLFFLSL
jgi:drug/metabolite transporter (DMT)-like permease